MILSELLDIGEMIMHSGGEVNRTEDTLTRMCKAYGAVNASIFVITSFITITMEYPDGRIETQSRHVCGSGSTDYYKLEQLNSLSRRCAVSPLSKEELAKEIQRIRTSGDNIRAFLKVLFGNLISAAAFTIFFGGRPADAVIAALLAIPLVYMQKDIAKYCPTLVIFNLLCSFVLGVGVDLICFPFPSFHADKIMIGLIMLLIPGIALTNAVRDVIVGDTLSGLLRLIESLLWAGALAIGIMISMLIIPGDQYKTIIQPVPIQLFAAFLGSLGFAMVYKMRKHLIIPAALGGILTWSVYLLAKPHFNYMGSFIPVLIASASGALYAEFLARRMKAPATLFLVVSLIPLFPGSLLYYTMNYGMLGNKAQMSYFCSSTIEFSLAIAAGMSLVWAIFEMIERIRTDR